MARRVVDPIVTATTRTMRATTVERVRVNPVRLAGNTQRTEAPTRGTDTILRRRQDCPREWVVAMRSPDDPGASSESASAATQVAGRPVTAGYASLRRLQGIDARPAREGENCRSETPTVEHLERLVPTEGRDLVGRDERELVSRNDALFSFGRLWKPLPEALDLSRGFSSARFDPFEKSHNWFAKLCLVTVHGVLDRRMADESIDGREPKLSFSQTLERGAIGIGRHVKVKAPDSRERTSVALGFHHDELDSAFPIPGAIFGEQSRPESPPTKLRTPNPEFFMGDDESRTAEPNLARGLADDLIGLIGDDPQMDQSARAIRQPQLATQKLGHHPSCLSDLRADIPHLEVQPSKCEPQIAFQQSVADRSDPVILINQLMPYSFAGRI
jgi:hypothetical protein